MRVLAVENRPFHDIPYETVCKRGWRAPARLPLVRGTVDSLPAGVDALVCAGDLQGREKASNGGVACPRLLGAALVDELGRLSEAAKVPPLARVGVALTGDLYIRPQLDSRRDNGDVRCVWRAFAQRCAWVTGVAGNHDGFGRSPCALGLFRRERGVRYLDRDVTDVGGLRVAGLSGVIGDPRRVFRKSDEDFLASVTSMLSWGADMLILHQGPNDEAGEFEGNRRIRECLAAGPSVFCVCGHSRWGEPLRELRNGSQVLNVDGRVVLLVAAGADGRWR